MGWSHLFEINVSSIIDNSIFRFRVTHLYTPSLISKEKSTVISFVLLGVSIFVNDFVINASVTNDLNS